MKRKVGPGLIIAFGALPLLLAGCGVPTTSSAASSWQESSSPQISSEEKTSSSEWTTSSEVSTPHEESSYVVDERYEYEVSSGEAHISKYIGDEDVIDVPSTLSGCRVVSIGDNAFKDAGAKEIHLPNTIKSIGYCAFENCASITEITIPSSVTSMGNTAFIGCSSLAKVIYRSNAFPDKGTLFKGSSIKTVVFDGTRVPDKACYACGNLTEIILGENISSLGSYCFFECTGLTSVKLPKALTYTGFYSFYSSGLTSIDLHEGITSVDNSFRDCQLSYVVLPVSLSLIEGQAFYLCPSTMKTYYRGNKAQWEQVSISKDSSAVSNHVFFYSKNEPSGAGNYWHYVNDVPVEW